MSTIRLADAATHYKKLSHQLAAWNWLQEQLSAEQLEEFAEQYRADPPIKASPPPGWVAPAIKLIKEFEGCRLEAYPDPGTGGAPWTIGYGTTRYMDTPVRKGDKVSQAMADELLANDVEALFGPGVLSLLPVARGWHADRIAALVSFAYNVGLAALEDSTLRKRLLKGEEPCVVVREELPKWCHAGEAVLAGLERRRKAEVDLFCNAGRLPVQQSGQGPLKVPYFSQRDSAVPGQGDRMCFSSTCAMLLAYLKPGVISGANADDTYLRRVLTYGDTTSADAQLKALASYGISAKFRQNCGWNDLEQQLARGIPVPMGVLHKGPSTKPEGGGHWLLAIGATSSHVLVNDPYGEMDLVRGGYLNSKGSGLAYSKANLGPRWMVEGGGTGWAIIATAP